MLPLLSNIYLSKCETITTVEILVKFAQNKSTLLKGCTVFNKCNDQQFDIKETAQSNDKLHLFNTKVCQEFNGACNFSEKCIVLN